MTYDENMGLAFKWIEGKEQPEIYLLSKERLRIYEKYKKMIKDKKWTNS